MTLNEWLRTIAAVLNDDEPGRPFQRYLVKDLLAAYHAALCLVARYRADLFTELRVIRLKAGKYQDARGCCSKVLDVLDQTDANGNVIHEINSARATTTTARRNWKKPSCLAQGTDDYIINTVRLDPNLDGRFTVEPPVPCEVAAYVMVKCVEQPCEYSAEMLNMPLQNDCVHNVAAWHYVLATMLSGDRHDNGASKDQSYHYRMFFDILGIVQKQDDRAESKEQAT